MGGHHIRRKVTSMLVRPTKTPGRARGGEAGAEIVRDTEKSVIAPNQSAGSALGAAIGVQIRMLRRGLDMTAEELAERAGVSGSMLSKIERGLASPSIMTLAALASALKVPVARFFTSYDERRDCSFVRAGKGVIVERRGSKCGHQYELLGIRCRESFSSNPIS